jgi:hypothetical protein
MTAKTRPIIRIESVLGHDRRVSYQVWNDKKKIGTRRSFTAARELRNLHLAAKAPATTSPRKATRLREIEEAKQGGQRA